MAIGYLISPVIQVEDINGKPLVGGRIRVYRHGTTIPYITYKDFNGDMNPAEVILDNKGMCVLLADVDGLYDVYCEDRNHVEQWSRLNVGAGQGGGGSSTGIDNIVSSDNSLVIIRTGSSVDITINRDGEASALEAYSGVIDSNGNFQFTADPINSVGDDIYIDDGQILCKKKWYHYDATVVLTWNGTPVNLEQDVVITGPDISDRVHFDLSVPHVETVDISGVCEIPQDDSPITFAIQSLPSGMTAQITNASIHAIEMGAGGGHTYQPGTGITIEGDTISVDQTVVAMQSDLPDMSGYQEKLTTGDGISIDQNNEISVKTDDTTITVNADGELVATGGSFTQVQADYAQTNDQAVDYIKNKPDLSVFARAADLATVANSGNYDDLINKPSIPTKTSDLTNDSGFITDADAPVKDVQVEGVSVVNAQGVAEISIPATGVLDVEVDGTSVVNAQGVAEITMPDLSGYATTQALTTGLAAKQDTISDLATIRSGAAAGATAVQPGDLAVVATTGSYDSLSNKPTINNVPAVTSSDNDKVLKASYSGGVGSYSWETEQGGSNYTAGDAIEIDNDEINVLYDSDTLELKSQEQTLTYALGTWDENYGRAYAHTNSDIRDILEGTFGRELTLHIPANTFYLHGTYGENIVLRISDDPYFNYSNYCLTPLAVTYDSLENKTWLDEQDIVLHTPTQDPDYWYIYSDHSAQYIAFAPTSGSNLCTITSASAGNNVTVTFTHAGGDPLLAVKNPLPASAIGDAAKVLTVDNTGAPVWATAASATVDQTYNASSTNAQSGTAVAGALANYTPTTSLATVATTGSYTDLSNTPSIPTATSDLTNDSGFITLSDVPAQAQADWTESDTSDPSYIQHKPQNLVQDASYVHTDNNFTTSLKDKLDGIASGAEVNVQSDWNQSDSNADDFIKNKPTINNVPAVTSSDDNKVLKASYSGGVGSYAWENDTSDVPAYTTSDDGKVLGVVDNQGTAELQWITGGSGTQVQSDWTENDSTDPAYIKHRPVEQLLSAGSGISIAESSGTVVISSNVSMSSLNTAGITDIQVVSALPASPVATVLYLIEET